MCFLHTFSCRMLHTLESTGFKSGKVGGHSSGKMNCGVSLSRNSTVARARCAGALSSLSCWKMYQSTEMCRISGNSMLHRTALMVLFIIFLVNCHVNMNCARNCENLLNNVKVMPKILLVPFFFRTRCRSPKSVCEFGIYSVLRINLKRFAETTHIVAPPGPFVVILLM